MDFNLRFLHEVAPHLRSLRKNCGLSQAKLAEYMGISRGRIAALERDASLISVAQLMGILQLLNVELVLRQIPHPEKATLLLQPGWQLTKPEGRW